MNKTELIDEIAAQTGASKAATAATINSFIEVVTKQLKKGDNVQLVGFGTFETAKRAAREGRNPQTGETIKIKATVVPKFKPGKGLKDAVAKKKK